MNTSWRERIAEARERKRGWRGWFRRAFTKDDHRAAYSVDHCAVAEAIEHTGLRSPVWLRIPMMLKEFHHSWYMDFPRAVVHQDVNEAERLLDLIDVRAMVLKREQSA